MHFPLEQREDGSSLEAYEQVLKSYKKLNGIINTYDQWEKSILEKEEKLRKAQEELEQKRQKYDNELGQYLEYLKSLEKSVQDASKAYVGQQEELKNREKQLKAGFDNLANLEKQLAQREEKLKQREMAIAEKEDYISNRESELLEKEDMLRKLESDIVALSQRSREHFKFEKVPSIQVQAKDNQVMTFRDENGSELGEDEDLRKKLKFLEEENYELFMQNKALQEEVIRLGLDINSEKATLIKEREQLMIKETMIKNKEQSLKKREAELVEKTKFVNSMILAVNQHLKVFKSREYSQIRDEHENLTTQGSTDPKVLAERKDALNYSNMFYGYNEGESKGGQSYAERMEEINKYHAKIAKLSRDFADKFDCGENEEYFEN